MINRKIGLLHPGVMGASVAQNLKERGHSIYWAPEGRSELTRVRAEKAGLIPLTSVEALCETSELILSLCPSAVADGVALQVAEAGFTGIFIEANAISPNKSRTLQALIENAGGSYVDGSVVGPPVNKVQATQLFLSGQRAEEAASVLGSEYLQALVLGESAGLASAVKMCDSAFNKSVLALLYQVLSSADQMGIREDLLNCWQKNPTGIASISLENDRLSHSAIKAGRWISEMGEILTSLEGVRQAPTGAVGSAKDVFRLLSVFTPESGPPGVEEILQTLRQG